MITDRQRHRSIGHASVQITDTHRGTGPAGQHLQFATGTVTLKSEITAERKCVAQTGLQSGDLQHGVAQGAHGRQCVGIGANLQHPLALRYTRRIESHQCAVGTNRREPTTA